MHVTFCGVGEAFDEREANTSILLEQGEGSLLLDCGFTAASAFWRQAREPLRLGAVCISHFHGDHFFGLPALLVRFMEQERTQELVVVGQPGVENTVRTLMELAYPGTLAKAGFDLVFLESAPGRTLQTAGFALSFARSDHSQPCLAVRAEAADRAVFYSGDGGPTEETLALARGADLLVHEAFRLEGATAGHGSVRGAVEFAREAGAARLALVHLRRDVRRRARAQVEALLAGAGPAALLPDEGTRLDLGPDVANRADVCSTLGGSPRGNSESV